MCRFLTLTLMCVCVCVLERIDRQKFTYRTREEPIINKDKHTHTHMYVDIFLVIPYKQKGSQTNTYAVSWLMKKSIFMFL